MTPSSSAPILGDSSSEFALAVTKYLLSKQLYMKLARAITQIVCPKVDLSADRILKFTFSARREERSSAEPASRCFFDNVHPILLPKPDNRTTLHSHSYNPPVAIPSTDPAIDRTLLSPPAIIDSSAVTFHLHWFLIKRIQSSPSCQSHHVRTFAIS